ncbi:MAG: phage holin family protein [Chthoniobacteraceae bacterium]
MTQTWPNTTMEEPRHSGSGALSHSLALVAEALRYLKLRAVLAGEEAKAAGVQYGVGAAIVAGALFVAVLGYIFLIITAVFAIALAFASKHAWIVVLGVTALLHLAGAVALISGAKKRVGNAPFPETLAEIERDRIWLRQLTEKH